MFFMGLRVEHVHIQRLMRLLQLVQGDYRWSMKTSLLGDAGLVVRPTTVSSAEPPLYCYP